MKISQNKRVEKRLLERGLVTRNECLRQFPAITRLAARIDDLEKLGYTFEVQEIAGDCIYRLLKRPVAKTLTLL